MTVAWSGPQPGGRRTSRLKRRMLDELVATNLAEIRGGPPHRLRRRGLPRAVGLAAAALVPLAVVAALSTPDGEGVAGAAGPSGPRAAAVSPSAAASPGTVPPAAGPAPARRVPGEALGTVGPEVFPLAVERVVLDPGHGGANGGTTTPSGLVEKDLTLDIARRLAGELAEGGFEVRMTRTEDVEMSLDERARFANGAEADLFVSIHVNWIENQGVRGVETYFLGTTDDPVLGRLAAAENRGSGYAMADLRDLLDDLYAGLRGASSERAARAIQRALLRSLRTVNPVVEDRGVKTAPFIVLMKTEMPAVLAEVSCLSNREEAELLARPLYRQYIAEALASGIESYAESLAGAPAARGTDS